MTSFFEINLPDETATENVARRLSSLLSKGDVVALKGELGAGKTSFARAAIRALVGKNIEVPSPTFTLVQIYEAPRFPVWHFDLYRLSNPDEVYEIGWEEALAEGVVLIEWPERLAGFLPHTVLTIELSLVPDGRNLILKGDDQWQQRLKPWIEALLKDEG